MNSEIKELIGVVGVDLFIFWTVCLVLYIREFRREKENRKGEKKGSVKKRVREKRKKKACKRNKLNCAIFQK